MTNQPKECNTDDVLEEINVLVRHALWMQREEIKRVLEGMTVLPSVPSEEPECFAFNNALYAAIKVIDNIK